MRIETENVRHEEIPVREGIVLDRDGRTIAGDDSRSQSNRSGETPFGRDPHHAFRAGSTFQAHVFRPRGLLGSVLGPLLGPIMGVLALTLFAFAGMTLIGVLLTAWAAYLIIRGILNILSLGTTGSLPRSPRTPVRRGF